MELTRQSWRDNLYILMEVKEMTDEERKLALYCLKASSDRHSEVCEECINYINCDNTFQDDVIESIIKAIEKGDKW